MLCANDPLGSDMIGATVVPVFLFIGFAAGGSSFRRVHTAVHPAGFVCLLFSGQGQVEWFRFLWLSGIDVDGTLLLKAAGELETDVSPTFPR